VIAWGVNNIEYPHDATTKPGFASYKTPPVAHSSLLEFHSNKKSSSGTYYIRPNYLCELYSNGCGSITFPCYLASRSCLWRLLTIVRSSQFTRRLHTTVAVLALLVTTLLCKATAKQVFIDHKDEKNILRGGVRSVIQVRIPHTAWRIGRCFLNGSTELSMRSKYHLTSP
jgi:hypothetical protein